MAITAEPTGTTRDHARLVWALIVLATVIALVSSLTVWVKRQALDTDSWVRASSALLQDDQVRQALSVYVVDQLYDNGNAAEQLQQSLPPALAPLAGPLAGALRGPAVTAVDSLLQRPRVQQLWARVNRVAHRELLAILNGNPRPNVSTANGDVVLDLRSFIIDVGTQLGVGGQLAQRLPADAGQVTVLRSDQLGAAQNVVKGIKALSVFLGLVTLLLWALALWLARGWRRVALRGIGVGLLIAGILLLVIRRVAGNYVVDQLTSGGDIRAAGHSAWLIGTTLLAEIGWAGVLYGLVVVAGTFLAGPSTAAVEVRARIAPLVAARPGLTWTTLGGVFLLVVWWGPTPALRRPLGVLLLAALLAVGFEALRRIVVSEYLHRTTAPVADGVPAQAGPAAGGAATTAPGRSLFRSKR
jgi:hypothetical protein